MLVALITKTTQLNPASVKLILPPVTWGRVSIRTLLDEVGLSAYLWETVFVMLTDVGRATPVSWAWVPYCIIKEKGLSTVYMQTSLLLLTVDYEQFALGSCCLGSPAMMDPNLDTVPSPAFVRTVYHNRKTNIVSYKINNMKITLSPSVSSHKTCTKCFKGERLQPIKTSELLHTGPPFEHWQSSE